VADLRSRGDLTGLRAVSRTYTDLVWDRDDRPLDLGAPARMEALRALTDFYGPEVVEALYEALGDRDANVRRAAVSGLLEVDSPAAATALIWAVVDWPEDHHSSLRAEAARGLTTMDVSGLPETFAARLVDSGRSAVSAGDRQMLEALLAVDARGHAAREVLVDYLIARFEVQSGPEVGILESLLEWLAVDSVEALLRCMEEGRNRVAAARVLGSSHDSRALDPLVELLADPDPDARATAALSLGQLKHAGAVEPLMHATRDEQYHVRDAAMAALDAMGAAAVTVGLAAMVQPTLPGGPPADNGTTRQPQQALPWAERMLGRMLGSSSRD